MENRSRFLYLLCLLLGLLLISLFSAADPVPTVNALGSTTTPLSNRTPFMAQQLPDPRIGPGLGNLSYSDDQLLQPIALVSDPVFMGLFRATYTQSWIQYLDDVPNIYREDLKRYGLNQGAMHNGYFIILFAPDSGQETGGWLVYDFSDPLNIKLVNKIFEPEGRTKDFRESHAMGFAHIDGRQYIAIHTRSGIEIWDFSDVMAPIQVSQLDLPGIAGGDYANTAWQLHWQAPYLYVTGANRGLYIVETADPYNPSLVDRNGKPNPIPFSQTGGFRLGPLFAQGNLLLVSNMDESHSFSTLDISDPINPQLLDTGPTIDSIQPNKKQYAPCLRGDHLIYAVRGGDSKMVVYDFADPTDIKVQSDSLEVGDMEYCATQGETIFQGLITEVAIIDASDPDAYQITGRTRIETSYPDMAQITPLGNLFFLGNDHGTGSGLFVHQTDPYKTPLQVDSVNPKDGATNQSICSRIGIAFSAGVEMHSLSPESFSIRPQGGDPVSGLFSAQFGIVNFSPDQPLLPETSYTISIPTDGVEDWMGNGLGNRFESSFTTGKQTSCHAFDSDPSEPEPEEAMGLFRYVRLNGLSPQESNEVWASLAEFNLLDPNGNRLNRSGWEILASSEEAVAADDRAERAIDGDDSSYWHSTWSGNDLPNYPHWIEVDIGEAVSLSGAALLPRRDKENGRIKGYTFEVSRDRNTWYQVAEGDLQAGASEKTVSFDIRPIPPTPTPAPTPVPPLVIENATGDQPQPINEAVTFTIEATEGESVEFLWEFGDGETLDYAVENRSVSHTYAEPGHYQVIVRARRGEETSVFSFIQTVHLPLSPSAPTHSSSIVSADNGLLYVVNRDNDSITAIDEASLTKLWEVTTGDQPMTLAVDGHDALWVANAGDDTLTVHNARDGAREKTVALPYGAKPFGIAPSPDGETVFVTLEGKGEIVKIDAQSREITGIGATGPRPRGIAVSGDGSRLFVTRYLSNDDGAAVWEYDSETLELINTFEVAPDTTTIDGGNQARGIFNYLNSIALSPDGTHALVPAKKDNLFAGTFRDDNPLTHETTVRAATFELDLEQGIELVENRFDYDNQALPIAAAYSPLGDYIFVAMEGTNLVAVLDRFANRAVTFIEKTGLAPSGLTLSADGSRLYVHNFLSRDVAAYDVSTVLDSSDFGVEHLGTVSTVETEALSATILKGKQIFYNASDPRMNKDGYLSCGSCHADGGHDGMSWDFTQRGEGVRNTTSLFNVPGGERGMLHWSGNFDELQDFELIIRNEFGGTGFIDEDQFDAALGPLEGSNAGKSEELDALVAYINSLDTPPRSPYRLADGGMSDRAQLGQTTFIQAGCATCHSGPSFTDSSSDIRHDVGSLNAASGSRLGEPLEGLDTPTLIGLWGSAPYLHDGSALTLAEVLSNPEHAGDLTPGEIEQLVDFLLQLDQPIDPKELEPPQLVRYFSYLPFFQADR